MYKYGGPLFSFPSCDINTKSNISFARLLSAYCADVVVVVIFIVALIIFIAHYMMMHQLRLMTLFSVQSCLLDDDYDDEMNI